MKITRAGAVIALSTALLMPVCTLPTQASTVYTETEGIPSMENPVRPDKNGVLELQNDALLDFIIPDAIEGITVDAIGAYAFEGCDLIRTVSIPASVTEIGEGAFSDCPYLQAIILKDRSDLQDMCLGTNWSGDAQVICEFRRTLPTEPTEAYLVFQQALADTERIHAITKENLPFVENQLTVLRKAYDGLQDEDPNSEHARSFQPVFERITKLIKEYKASLSVPEPPADPAPAYSQPVPENNTDTGTEMSVPDAFLPENMQSDFSQPVTEANDTADSSENYIDVTETTISPEPSIDSAGESSQNIPSEEVTE